VNREVNEADRMILWAEMDADNTGQVTKDEFEDPLEPEGSGFLGRYSGAYFWYGIATQL
jgi:hypothetical protein